MSVYLFVNILHFFDNLQGSITNFVGKIQAVYDYLREKFKKVFYPYKSVVIDERLILQRGNISFCQYIPSKSHRFVLKLVCICDCKSGFV